MTTKSTKSKTTTPKVSTANIGQFTDAELMDIFAQDLRSWKEATSTISNSKERMQLIQDHVHRKSMNTISDRMQLAVWPQANDREQLLRSIHKRIENSIKNLRSISAICKSKKIDVLHLDSSIAQLEDILK